ncbi:MAG: hypothetical protein GY813_09290 [Halieaceae bacterium]|nr:hypothetical protein [Halieaceae bacterium]
MTFLQPLDRSWDRTSWCVPSALAILTGCTVSSAHSKFAFINREDITKVSGCYAEDLLCALLDAGKQATPVDLHSRYPKHKYGPRLKTYLKDRPFNDERMYPLLLETYGHVQCVHMDYLASNWYPRPIKWSEASNLNDNLHRAWIIK